MRNCIYAGVFDPPHKGHENIIERLLKMFDSVTVAILKNADKSPKMDEGCRARLLQTIFSGEERVKVRVFDGLLTDFARKEEIYTIARGIRNASDLEYEKQLAAVYTSQCDKIDVIYLPADPSLSHVSSSTVRELVRLGGDISKYINELILEDILRSY